MSAHEDKRNSEDSENGPSHDPEKRRKLQIVWNVFAPIFNLWEEFDQELRDTLKIFIAGLLFGGFCLLTLLVSSIFQKSMEKFRQSLIKPHEIWFAFYLLAVSLAFILCALLWGLAGCYQAWARFRRAPDPGETVWYSAVQSAPARDEASDEAQPYLLHVDGETPTPSEGANFATPHIKSETTAVSEETKPETSNRKTATAIRPAVSSDEKRTSTSEAGHQITPGVYSRGKDDTPQDEQSN